MDQKEPNGGMIKAELDYGLHGEYKIDVYDQNSGLVDSTNWFSNYIPTSGLEHPQKYPFAACFEALSIGIGATDITPPLGIHLNNQGTTGLFAPLNVVNSQSTIPVEQYMHSRYWETGREVGGEYFAGSCGTHFPSGGPIMFRGWRIPTGTGFAKVTTTVNEFAVFPGTSGIKNEKGNIEEPFWKAGCAPCFSRVVKNVAIQKDQFAIVNYRLQVKMKHTGATTFAPGTFDSDGIHADSPLELSGLWSGLSGKFKQVVPAISFVTEKGESQIPPWGDYLEPACTGHAEGGYWYLSPDKLQFIGSKSGGPINPTSGYDDALCGYFHGHIMQGDGEFSSDVLENTFPPTNIRRGEKGSNADGILIPSTGNYLNTIEAKYAQTMFAVDHGQINKEPYDITQRGDTNRERKQLIKAFWAANQGRGTKYRFRSMVYGGVPLEGGSNQGIYPNIDFMFSDDSGYYPAFRKDIGVISGILTYSGEGYASAYGQTAHDNYPVTISLSENDNRRASVSNDPLLVDTEDPAPTLGDLPVSNSGASASLFGLYAPDEDPGYGQPVILGWSGSFTGFDIYYKGENYTGVPDFIPPTNWNTLEVAGQNPDVGYYDLTGMRQCISGYYNTGVGDVVDDDPNAGRSGHYGMGVYTGKPPYSDDILTMVPPKIQLEGGSGIEQDPLLEPITGTGTAIMGLYDHELHGKVFGVTGVEFDVDPWNGKYKSTRYVYNEHLDSLGSHQAVQALGRNAASGIPTITFVGGSVSGSATPSESGILVLTQNARASGYFKTGENYMIKDQYAGTDADGILPWYENENYKKIGNYPYKDNLNILTLFLEVNWSGQDSGNDGN